MISYCCSLPKYQIDSPPGLISETCTSQGTSNGQIGQRFSALENKKNALCSAKIACSAHKGLQKTALKAQRGSKSQQNPKRPGQKGSTTRRARAIPSTLLLRSTLYILMMMVMAVSIAHSSCEISCSCIEGRLIAFLDCCLAR